MIWDTWKKGFDAWEDATARYVEQWMKSPFVLGPSGALLTLGMKAKAASEKAKATFWGELGLPTKRDQERALHMLNRLESKILDLEEQLEATRADLAKVERATT